MASRCHVLIVEDDPLIVDVVVASLELEYRVSSVNTVGAALAYLRTSHVDMVLIDSVLPDGRGTEAASFADGLGAAVIEMAGYPRVMDDLERSARLHLLKPFGVQALLSTIGHALHSACRPDTRTHWPNDATTASEGHHDVSLDAGTRRYSRRVVDRGAVHAVGVGRHTPHVRLARCSISTARCWMSGAVSSFRRTSPPSLRRTRSDMPPRFSARATSPHRHGSFLHLKCGPTPAGCSLRR
jgi:CheY-like chemotaxis protein